MYFISILIDLNVLVKIILKFQNKTLRTRFRLVCYLHRLFLLSSYEPLLLRGLQIVSSVPFSWSSARPESTPAVILEPFKNYYYSSYQCRRRFRNTYRILNPMPRVDEKDGSTYHSQSSLPCLGPEYDLPCNNTVSDPGRSEGGGQET